MDTAVSVPGRGLYVFSGDQLWRYSSWRRGPDPGYPKPITAEFPGAFQRDLDAAMLHPDGSLYLFRGDRHIRYSLAANRPELGYPRPYAPDWPGVFPDRIDAAITWAPDIIYLFHGDAYTSFSPRRASARPGYPKPITGNWPGIHGGPVRAMLTMPGDRTLVLTETPGVLDSEGGLVPAGPAGLPGFLPAVETLEAAAPPVSELLPSSAGPLRSSRFSGDPHLAQVIGGRLRLGAPGTAPYPAPVISTGPAVAKVQQALIDLGYSLPHGADGHFGVETGAAVRQYKARHGLVPGDPVVGAGTVAALDHDMAAHDGPPAPSPAPSTEQKFIGDAVGPAQATQAEYGVPASVTLAQAILESGWGQKHIGSANNYFGIKAQGPASFGPIAIGAVQAPTREVINGQSVMVNAWFRAYKDMNDSFRDHGAFLKGNSRYRTAFQYIKDPDEFARQIAKAGYATDPNYANSLIDRMRTYNLYQYDQN